ncbi:phage replisome organizer N-terminal domain-containing protein [Paenibacillus sp. CAU 1782]
MADNKKYYYMKLKENFFDSDEMIMLEALTDGYLYSNILLKLYLRSLKDDGRLMFKGIIPYTPDALANILRHKVGVVEKAIQVLKQFGLVEILDNGAIYMLDIQNFIGESSTEADRVRAYRKKVEDQKKLLVTNDVQMYDKSTPEIKERDKDKESSSSVDAFMTYQNSIGMISPTIRDMIQDNIDFYGEPMVCDAIKEASRQGKNKLSYVEGILRKWHTDGRSKGPKSKVAHHDLPSESEVRAAERRKQEEMDRMSFEQFL